MISLSFKRGLCDSYFVNRQNVRPSLVNKALDKLKKVNPLYRCVRIDGTWESVSKENDLSLKTLLINENAENDDLQTDSDDDFFQNCIPM